MNCYNHPDRPALGICKSCFRALCADCAAEVGKAVACRNRCEEDLRAVQALVDANVAMRSVGTQLARTSRSALLVAGLFVATVGVAFAAFGWTSRRDPTFFLALGALFAVYGGYQIARALRLPAPGGR